MVPLWWGLGALCLVLAVSLMILIVRDRTLGDLTFVGLLVLEAGLLVNLVAGLLALGGRPEGLNIAAWVGYLTGAVVIVPVGYLWSLGERSRGGTGVLLVAVLVLPVLFLRLHQLWSG